MYRAKLLSLLLPIALFFTQDGFSAMQSFFTPNEMAIVKKGEMMTYVSLKDKGEVKAGGIEKISASKNEYINIVPTNFDIVAIEKGFFNLKNTAKNRMEIYKTLTNIQRLKGMPYYSITDKKNVALVLDSSNIESSENSISPNTTADKIPQNVISHFSITDNRLGVLKFKNEFICDGQNFISINTSIGTSSKYGMKIFDPGDYKIYKIFIYDANAGGYYYFMTQYLKVRSNILNSLNVIKPDSFGNRTRAESVHFLKGLGIDRSQQLAAFQ